MKPENTPITFERDGTTWELWVSSEDSTEDALPADLHAAGWVPEEELEVERRERRWLRSTLILLENVVITSDGDRGQEPFASMLSVIREALRVAR